MAKKTRVYRVHGLLAFDAMVTATSAKEARDTVAGGSVDFDTVPMAVNVSVKSSHSRLVGDLTRDVEPIWSALEA